MPNSLGGNAEEQFREAIPDNESLKIFLRKMHEFSKKFCEGMLQANDFTIRLEVRCDNGAMLHAKVYTDDIERPKAGKKKHR